MSEVYPKFVEQLISWAMNANAPAGLALYAVGVDTGYTYNASHNDTADIPGGAISIAEFAVPNMTYVNGIIDGDDVDLTGLTPSETLDAVIVYLKSGAGATFLVAYIDDSVDGSIPQVIEGTKARIAWNPSGIALV